MLKNLTLKAVFFGTALTPAIALLIACGSSDNKKRIDLTEPKNALPLVVENRIIPSVKGFNQSVGALQQTANHFCAQLNDSNEQNITELQNSWKAMNLKWYPLLSYRFGPLNDDILEPAVIFIDNYRESKGRDYTDVTRNDIAKDLASSEVLNTAYFNKKLSNKVGILALEVLLFDGSKGAILQSYKDNERKCQILEGQAELLKSYSQSIEDKWSTYKDKFTGNTLSEGDSLVVLFTNLQDYLNHLQTRNVATNTGKLSNHGWDNVSAAVDEMKALLSDHSPSIFDFMLASTAKEQEIETIKSDIQAVKEAINDKDSTVLNTTLGRLDGHFKRTIPNSLGITLGLNFNDGD